MSIISNITAAAARAELRLAKRFGVQVTFTDPIQGSVNVWGFLNLVTQTGDLRHGETDVLTYTFQVPRQTGFPFTNNFNPGCAIQFPISTGPLYQVDLTQPGVEDYTVANDFIFTCRRYGPASGTSAEID